MEEDGSGAGPGQGPRALRTAHALAYPEQGGWPPALISGTAIGRSIVDLPLSLIQSPFHLRDTDSGETVAYQVVTPADPRAPTPWAAVDAPIAGLGGLRPGYVSYAHHGVTPPGPGHEFLGPGELDKGHVYAYVIDNNFRANLQDVQVSDVVCRYSLSRHEGDWGAGRSRDLGWGVANPLVSVCMAGQKEGWLPQRASFCGVDQSNVLLLTLKREEDEDGAILRLIETEGRDGIVSVAVPLLNIRQAYEMNLVEENQRLLSFSPYEVKASLKPFGITTIRLQTE